MKMFNISVNDEAIEVSYKNAFSDIQKIQFFNAMQCMKPIIAKRTDKFDCRITLNILNFIVYVACAGKIEYYGVWKTRVKVRQFSNKNDSQFTLINIR